MLGCGHHVSLLNLSSRLTFGVKQTAGSRTLSPRFLFHLEGVQLCGVGHLLSPDFFRTLDRVSEGSRPGSR